MQDWPVGVDHAPVPRSGFAAANERLAPARPGDCVAADRKLRVDESVDTGGHGGRSALTAPVARGILYVVRLGQVRQKSLQHQYVQAAVVRATGSKPAE